MDAFRTFEKNGGRLETRTGFVAHDAGWLSGARWKNLSCVRAIRHKFECKGWTSDEWHYCISGSGLELCVHGNRVKIGNCVSFLGEKTWFSRR